MKQQAQYSLAELSGHSTWKIITTAGRIVSGFKVSETNQEVTIGTATKGVQKIPVDEIDDHTPMKNSFMPSGLERTMSKQNLLDLVAYLTQQL